MSVIIPLHNRADLVGETMESVLAQTMEDFEVIVVDDASTDGGRGIAVVEAFGDPRVRVVALERNGGVSHARNVALDLARGEWVAFQDSDDLWVPEKLARQLEVAEAQPVCGMVATWARDFVDERGERRWLGAWRPEPDAGELRAGLLFNNPFATPSVMVRRDLIEAHGLRFWERTAEDYDLWRQVAEIAEARVVPEELTWIRQHAGRMTTQAPQATLDAADDVREKGLVALGIEPTDAERRLHGRIGRYERLAPGELRDAARWMARLLRANRDRRLYPSGAFARALGYWWLQACARSTASPFVRVRAWLAAPPAHARPRVGYYRHALRRLSGATT